MNKTAMEFTFDLAERAQILEAYPQFEDVVE